MSRVIPELAHGLGFVPLLWLVGMWLLGTRRDRAWWWLAGAYGISWVADTTAHWVDPWMVSAVYPVSQAALIAAVLATRPQARVFLGVLVVAGLLALLVGVRDSTLFLRAVAWGGIVWLVWPLVALGRLRVALFVTFGLGFVAWVGYLLAPGWTTWGVYQAVRVVGAGLFCWAAWSPIRIRLA